MMTASGISVRVLYPDDLFASIVDVQRDPAQRVSKTWISRDYKKTLIVHYCSMGANAYR